MGHLVVRTRSRSLHARSPRASSRDTALRPSYHATLRGNAASRDIVSSYRPTSSSDVQRPTWHRPTRLGRRVVRPVRFQEESEPAEYVEQLAEQMLPTTRYEDLHILKGPYVMENWDPEMMEVRTYVCACARGGYLRFGGMEEVRASRRLLDPLADVMLLSLLLLSLPPSLNFQASRFCGVWYCRAAS